MEVNHFVTLYLTAPTATVIEAVQGDGVRVIAASLMEGADPWPVPEGVSAGISYELPDKKRGYYDQLRDGTPACVIAGNLVTAAIDSSLTAAAGNVKLSIVLRDSDGGQVATFPIALRVAKRPGRIGAEEMAPPSAYAGKLLMGGRAGDIVPVEIGDGLSLERTPTGATLSAPGGGGSGDPGGSCDCGAPYIASGEPPEDTRALWIDTSEPDEAVALGATVVETAEGVEIYANDELGPTRATVRHGRDGNTPVKGVDYFTDAEIEGVARQAAAMVDVPGGSGGNGGGAEYTVETVPAANFNEWTILDGYKYVIAPNEGSATTSWAISNSGYKTVAPGSPTTIERYGDVIINTLNRSAGDGIVIRDMRRASNGDVVRLTPNGVVSYTVVKIKMGGVGDAYMA